MSVFTFIETKYRLLLLGCLILLLCVFRLYWMVFFITVFGVGCFILNQVFEKKEYKSSLKYIKSFTVFLAVLIISGFIKVFVADIYRIPSDSMEETLFPEDIILVNKLVYGPRIPKTYKEIPWVNLFSLFIKDKEKEEQEHKDYKRLSGVSSIQYNDIIVFLLREGFSVVKRCVAKSGDIIELRKGELYINGEWLENELQVRDSYKVVFKDYIQLYNDLDSLKISKKFHLETKDTDNIILDLTEESYKKIKLLSNVISIHKNGTSTEHKILVFDIEKSKNWSPDNFGPIRVPQKGMTIPLNKETISIYGHILKLSEPVDFETDGFEGVINGKKVDTYTFSKDYLFLMGDNRKYSFDSRFLGFIDKNKVIGKVERVVLSMNQGTFRWDRLLKKVN